MAEAHAPAGSGNGVPARAQIANPMRGTMLWFNQDKDLGVINTEAGEGLRVYGRDFAPGERPLKRCAGAEVTFSITAQGEERTATAVSFIPEVAPRRARMRHGRYRSG
jgi:cold shock CspA family protein